MITAIMARKNTEGTKKNLVRQTKERAWLFCENKISPVITAASKDGEDHILVNVDEDIDMNEVTINLIERQFQVYPGTNGRSISIMW